MKYFVWGCRLVACGILFQTLFFKFSGAPESIYIFDTLGVGDFGRYGAGASELIAGILLILPKFTKVGSIMAVGIMAGAIVSHLAILGIEVQGDGGLLFGLAILVLTCAVLNFFLTKEKFSMFGYRI